jgi:EAL domain-containing protein (putative c-di-GMP-specific phosphodiesterase class I)
MSKKMFALLADKETAGDEALIQKIRETIEASGGSLKVLPSVDKLTQAEAKKSLDGLAADAIIYGGTYDESKPYYKIIEKDTDSLDDNEKAELETVRKILDENLLTYNFQPIINAATGQIFAYEALMRPTVSADTIGPLKILKYADKLGRLGDVEKATFLNVTALIDKNKDRFGDRLVFINSIPGARLLPDDYIDVESALMDHAESIVVEMTEQTEADEITLRAIKRRYELLGIGIALDDYGTGYSNVMNLLQYMPGYVKIDRSLLAEIDKNPKKQRFVREIIEFCKDNNILSLAEGVETWRELRMVVRMGVDLIQGFYVAMPSEDILSFTNSEIKREILRYRDEYKAGKKQPIYIADSTGRVTLSSLARANYSCILIGKDERESKEITVSGVAGLKSNAHIEIAGGYEGTLTLDNTYLVGKQGSPCIVLGDNCDVTLILIGDNHLEKGGILVPDSSTLRLLGAGNITIGLDAQSSYGIGNDLEASNGHIIFDQDGIICIDVKGNSGVAIGSGSGGPIDINRGKYILSVNCGYGVGVGSFKNSQDVNISDCEFELNLGVTKGVGIGSMDGNSSIKITNASVKCNAEGTEVSGIGSIEGNVSRIQVGDASLYLELRGDYITGVGSLKGTSDYIQERATLRVGGSGSHLLAFGGLTENTSVAISDSDSAVDILTACQKDTYAPDDRVVIKHGKNKFIVNGYPYDHHVDYGEVTK